MKNKYLSPVLVSCAIALSAFPLKAEEKATSAASNSVFVCATQGETPTLFAYNPGEVNLAPLMSWYGEYLMPGQSGAEICQRTANALQDSYQQDNAKYLKADAAKKESLVCLVEQEDQNCFDEKSQKLFSVNSEYDPSCVLENKSPIDCQVYKVRGIYSFNDEPYQPLWWPW